MDWPEHTWHSIDRTSNFLLHIVKAIGQEMFVNISWQVLLAIFIVCKAMMYPL